MYLKIRLWRKCFSVNSAIFLRTPNKSWDTFTITPEPLKLGNFNNCASAYLRPHNKKVVTNIKYATILSSYAAEVERYYI